MGPTGEHGSIWVSAVPVAGYPVWGQGRVGPGEFALIGRATDAGGAKFPGGVIAKAAPVGILKIYKGNFGLPLPVRMS
ncbi:hypothetical protein [Kamptonema formosum]|uniref:hypothetical protein n=1 Tax=Kamptonema formosum TaxID=331992 RepID=UPI00034B6BA4|nr:hypothetical protein [Oscillatoria sp. PCC 10802]